MDDRKIIFALDIGTRSVVGVVGALKDDQFSILDYEQEFHEKRAMRDGQIEDIDLVAQVVRKVKTKLEERSGQTFTKVSIAAAGRALKTASGSFSYDLIPNEPITDKLVQYLEYSAIDSAQKTFTSEASDAEEFANDYYCVGYSVKEYLLDNYKIKSLDSQKGHQATVNIIAAFLPASVLIGLYAVTARCGLEVDNLTLEPIAAIHAVVPEDVRFLNIALVDIGGGTSDIAISKDGSVIAYDMVTIAGDEITEALMQHYLTNFATAERIKLSMKNDELIEFKDILGNQFSITAEDAFKAVEASINNLADSIGQRILLTNGTAPAAVFLVGGGSQIRDLPKSIANKLGMPEARVALGVANTETNLSLFSEDLYNPTFVTPIGIGIVSSLYRGCDFFAITVNGKRVMLFNHQTIKVIDALVLSGIKPSSLIGLTAPNLVYTLNGVRKTVKGSPGIPGKLLVNNAPATIETEIKQGDEITAILAENGTHPEITLFEALTEFAPGSVFSVEINGMPLDSLDEATLKSRKLSYMDNVIVSEKDQFAEAEKMGITLEESDFEASPAVEISKIHSDSTDVTKHPRASLLLADDEDTPQAELPATKEAEKSDEAVFAHRSEDTASEIGAVHKAIDVMLNGMPIHLVQETEEPLILMHLLKYVELDVTKPRGQLILRINGVDSNYADPIHNHDIAIIKWSDDM